MNKNQHNSNVWMPTSSEPKKIGIYLNERSGNYFHGNPCDTCKNRIKPSKVWIDDDGYIQVEI